MQSFTHAAYSTPGHAGPVHVVCTPKEAYNKFWSAVVKQPNGKITAERVPSGVLQLDGLQYSCVMGQVILNNENLYKSVREVYGGHIVDDFAFWLRTDDVPGNARKVLDVIENTDMGFRCGARASRAKTIWTVDCIVDPMTA